ncbi:MAG: restriction endonuclease subunit S, partial [Methylotenera sp.]
MKAGWEVKKLGDISTIELGKTPSRANKSFWDEELKTRNVWLSIADLLNTEGNVVSDSKEYLSDKGAAFSKTVLKGTLLVSFKLTLGRLAFAGRDLFTNEAIAALSIFNEKVLSKEFLFYFLYYFDWRKAAENDAKIKGMTLNKAKLKELLVYYPNLEEQQRIVAILDQAFEGIAKARANAEQNLQNAHTLFESHLQSVFTQHGEGWAEKRLDEVSKVVSGYSFKSTDFSSTNQIKAIKITNVGVKEFVDNFDNMLPIIYKNKYEVFSVKKGSIVIALTRTIIQSGLKVAIVPNEYDGALLNQRVAAITADPKYAIDSYIYLYLSTKQVEQYVKNHVNTLMQPNLSINDLKALSIPLPTIVKQKELVTELETLSYETQKLEARYQRKIELLDELKKLL